MKNTKNPIFTLYKLTMQSVFLKETNDTCEVMFLTYDNAKAAINTCIENTIDEPRLRILWYKIEQVEFWVDNDPVGLLLPDYIAVDYRNPVIYPKVEDEAE